MESGEWWVEKAARVEGRRRRRRGNERCGGQVRAWSVADGLLCERKSNHKQNNY
jgi:hypothetical protein